MRSLIFFDLTATLCKVLIFFTLRMTHWCWAQPLFAVLQFSANGLSPLAAADEVASLDNNTQQYLVAKNPIDPSLLASFRAAAATVFGFNTQTLSHARGLLLSFQQHVYYFAWFDNRHRCCARFPAMSMPDIRTKHLDGINV